MGCNWSISYNLNTLDVCWIKQVQMDEAECHWKVASGRMVAGATRSLANARDL